MTTTLTSTVPETSNENTLDNDAFSASVLNSLFHSLAGMWTHELRIHNATVVDLQTIGHGFCNFTPREATKIKGEDTSTSNLEEMLLHENGEYTVEGGPQAALHVPSLLWSRNFVWRMDFGGSNPAVARPQVEKRRDSHAGRKGSIFRRRSSQKSDSPVPESHLTGRRMSVQSGKGSLAQVQGEASIWRRMSVPIIRRKSRAEALGKAEPFQEEDHEDTPSRKGNEEPVSPAPRGKGMPQIDIYATKPDSRKMSFHLHTLRFDLQPDIWRQRQTTAKDFTVEAYGDHFTGEERYGTKYEFLMRSPSPTKNVDADDQYYVKQWNTVEIVRGPAGKDKTTTTSYAKSREQRLAEASERG